MKKRTRVVIVLILISMLTIIGGSFLLYQNIKKEEKLKIELKEKTLIKKITSKYSNFVKVTKDTKLYQKENNQYKEIGQVTKDTKLKLVKEHITKDTKYFKIANLNYYIKYHDVIKTEEFTNDTRYKNYLPFNENVVTENTKLYQNDKLIYNLNVALDKPIIKKDADKIYIEYNDDLYYLNNKEIKTTYIKENTTSEKATKIPVTAYHFIYLHGESCNEMICHSEDQIREQFTYLKGNNYFTMTTKEMEYFLDGKINLPKNSILITIDDGARAEKFIPILEEYKINATLFLVTGWYEKEKFASPYMELASHSNDLHKPGLCPGGQGSPLKCLDKNTLLTDLKTSREKLNNTEAFCFPFYEFNDYALSVVEEAGFKVAFIGGMRMSYPGINKYKIPRITLHKDTSLAEYINLIKT